MDDDLVLTGPYRGISAAYGCFAIRIDIPKTPSSSSGDTCSLPIEWEWDYDVKQCANQVDASKPSEHTITTKDGAGKDVEVAMVTYAVMSNALDGSVQVKLLLSDDEPSPAGGVYGEVTAYIGGFQKGSKLFNRTETTQQRFSSTDSRELELDLARSVVAVPCGWLLRIHVDLTIVTSNTTDYKANLIFNNGDLIDQAAQVKAEVTWYPEVKNIEEMPKQQDSSGPQVSIFVRDWRALATV